MGYMQIVSVTLVFQLFIRGSELKLHTQPISDCDDLLSSNVCSEIKKKGQCPFYNICDRTCELCKTPECGSYSAISHMIAEDRVHDISHLVLNKHGGMAALHSSKTDFHSRTAKCGAVLVSDRYLLTAAHCMAASEGLTSISLGRDNLDESPIPGPDTYQIVETSIYPQYNRSRNSYHDIAIIKTERKVEFSKNIWPYCLPERNQVLDDFMPLEISGWGFVNQIHRASVLKNCKGDSGGPLSHLNKKGRKIVIGLVSKGTSLCPELPVIPGRYTNVFEYLDWIKETTGIQQLSSPSSSPTQPEATHPAATGSLDGCGIRKLQSQNTNPLEAGFGEFPWMARIINTLNVPSFFLGALISSNWVLTPASRVQRYSPQNLKVVVGALHRDTDLDQSEEEVPVDQIISHPQYNVKQWRRDGSAPSWHNDVALLHLKKSVNMEGLPHIGPICLPDQGETFTGQRCWLTGWVRSATRTSADNRSVLQKESLPIWDPLVCASQLRKSSTTPQNFTLDKSSSLCAGGEPGRNVCGGGAPLVCEGRNGRYVLVGLTSWWVGNGDGTCIWGNYPYIFSNIPNMLNFIKKVTGI
ncbi:unnamed protein product [Meganyctiphanes norvegica]|uniref:Peptidase S1 domain-containing protein n=1 Tax=Meganyctiphanes norvegica TaxID=48144 RepID=A0AAV2QEW6_MEGNR